MAQSSPVAAVASASRQAPTLAHPTTPSDASATHTVDAPSARFWRQRVVRSSTLRESRKAAGTMPL